jgi:HEAT repeat protein
MDHELVAYIPFFIEQARHLHPHHRDVAIDELAAIGPPAIPALMRNINDDNYFARLSAAEALCKMDNEPARTALLRALERTEHPEVRRVVLRYLSKFRRDLRVAIVILRVAQRDTYIQWWVRRMGIEQNVIRHRINLLANSVSPQREALLHDLLQTRDGTALRILRELLSHHDIGLRMLATDHLADESLYGDTDQHAEPRQFARARSVQALMDALNDEPEPLVRLSLVRTLGCYQEFTLQVRIALKLTARTDPDDTVRAAASDILAAIPEPGQNPT